MNCFRYRCCLLSTALSFIANVAFGQGFLSLNGEVASAGSSSSLEYGYFSDGTKYSAAGTNDYYPYGARHGNAVLLAGTNRWQKSTMASARTLTAQLTR